MPSCANVTINYGPYYSFGVLEHNTKRLEGLIKILTAAGHSVNLVPFMYRDLVELTVNDRIVYSCDILDMDFDGDGQMDCTCIAALNYVNAAN